MCGDSPTDLELFRELVGEERVGGQAHVPLEKNERPPGCADGDERRVRRGALRDRLVACVCLDTFDEPGADARGCVSRSPSPAADPEPPVPLDVEDVQCL